MTGSPSDRTTLLNSESTTQHPFNSSLSRLIQINKDVFTHGKQSSERLFASATRNRHHADDSGDEDDDEDEDDNYGTKVNSSIPSAKNNKKRKSFHYKPFLPKSISSAALPHLSKTILQFALGTTVLLYILNQQHVLPKPLSAIVSKVTFWPSAPITMSRRIGRWSTEIDDTVVLGGAPWGFMKIPEKLYDTYGVRGVINMCEEYQGPVKSYKKLGMEHLHLPTTDHFEPSFEDMKTAVEFIQKYETMEKGRVYVHCKAGHGRSAAIVYAWLLSKQPDTDKIDMKAINEYLCKLRGVRETLWKQPNVNKFRSWLNLGGDRSVQK